MELAMLCFISDWVIFVRILFIPYDFCLFNFLVKMSASVAVSWDKYLSILAACNSECNVLLLNTFLLTSLSSLQLINIISKSKPHFYNTPFLMYLQFYVHVFFPFCKLFIKCMRCKLNTSFINFPYAVWVSVWICVIVKNVYLFK